MRSQAKKIYLELEKGKQISKIKGNPKTKARVNKMFLYRKLMDRILKDIIENNYTLSTYDIQNMLKPKKKGI